MDFTYDSYKNLLSILSSHGYSVVDYRNWNTVKRGVILRHDIDCSLKKALQLAELENVCGVKSTYFVLITADFYNVFSHESYSLIHKIQNLGHEIGLHFDEMNYPEIVGNPKLICDKILWEKELLQYVTGNPVTTFSMHRPSREILKNGVEVPEMINSYSELFFKRFKYLSDSRHHWREPIESIIESGEFEYLQILTHAAGYSINDKSLEQWVRIFLNEAKLNRWEILNKNFTDLEKIVPREETTKYI